MNKYPRVERNLDFVGRSISKLNEAQRALFRRTDYKGANYMQNTTSNPLLKTKASTGPYNANSTPPAPKTLEVEHISVPIKDLDGYTIEDICYLTITSEKSELVEFSIEENYQYYLYTNTPNLIDVKGKIAHG